MKATFNVVLAIIIVAILVMSTSATTWISRIFTQLQAQTLPTCIDPTDKNLPCMIVISTLPAPTNTVQCQEPTGQILPCSYATQILSNGQQVVVITVYVQPNFVFTGGPISVVKEVILHETKTHFVFRCPPSQDFNKTSGKCEDKSHPPPCERPDSDAVTDLDKDLKTKNCDISDANEINKTPFPSPPPPTCNSQISNATCPAPPVTNSTGSSNSKSLAKGGSSSEKNNVTSPIDCKANPSDPSCLQKLTTKKCSDGSVIAASALCPTNIPPTPLTLPNPSNNPQIATNNNPSTPGSENNPQSPTSNNPSSNSQNGGSSSGSSNSGSSGSKHHHHN